MAISRPDDYGFQVRVRRNGRVYSKYFSLRRHGGERAARTAARLYQAALVLKLPKLPPVEATIRNRTTGVRGVCLVRYRNKRRGLTIYDYKVRYIDARTGKSKVRAFYIGTEVTYDKKRAAAVLKRAIRFRRARDREWRRALGVA
jgi:hypothetical protein